MKSTDCLFVVFFVQNVLSNTCIIPLFQFSNDTNQGRATSATAAVGYIPTAVKHVEHRQKPNFHPKAHFHAATNHRHALKPVNE